MSRIQRIVFNISIALTICCDEGFAAEFNFRDSISLLSSITVDSTYQSLVGNIVNAYAKEKMTSESKSFLLSQVKLQKENSQRSPYLFFLLSRVYYQEKDYKGSINLLDSIFQNSKKISDDLLGKLYRLRGQNYFRMQDFAGSITSFKQSLDVLKKNNDKEQMDDVLAAISAGYFELDNLPDALNYAQQAEVISKETNDLVSRSRILNTIGNINKTLRNLNEAAKNYSDCFEVASKTGDKEGMVLSRASLAMIEVDKKNYQSAWKHLEEALSYATELDNKHLIGGTKLNMANARMEEGLTGTAMDLYLEAAAIAQEINDTRNLGLINANIGFMLTEEKKYRESNRYLEVALPYAKEMEDITLIKEIAGGFYDNYKALNQVKEALAYHEMYSTYSDSLLNDDKSRELNNLRTVYAVSEKERELNSLAEKEKLISNAEIKRQKLMRNFSIAGGVLFLILAGFIFQRYRERYRTSLLLSEKNKTIEKSYHDLKATQEELVETVKQREVQSIRVRIARDIHDDIGSGLTKITMLSDVARKRAQQEDVATALSRITSFSIGVSESLSEIVWAINPGHDNVTSLVTYLNSAAVNLLQDSPLEFELNFPDREFSTPVHPEVKRNIYLVMKEAINNAMKYSGATKIIVEFKVNGNNFKLIVSDNGKGFIPDTTGENGNGLRNMSDRMKQHGNSLQVISSPGNGCKIIADGNLMTS